MSVLAEMIVKSTKSSTNLPQIFAIVCEFDPVDGVEDPELRRGIKNALSQMSNREVGMRYDILKNRGLI
jgi:hypothetical protein